MKLSKYIIGQDRTVNIISQRILNSSFRLKNADKITVPTGVEKNETAKQVAKLWANDKLYTIDMTTFSAKEDISRLIRSSVELIGYDYKNAFIDFIK